MEYLFFTIQKKTLSLRIVVLYNLRTRKKDFAQSFKNQLKWVKKKLIYKMKDHCEFPAAHSTEKKRFTFYKYT